MMQYDEMLVIIRCLDEEGITKYDYYLSNAPSNTPLKEFARVATAAHRIEEAIKHFRKAPALHSPLRARTAGDDGDQVADLSEKSTRVPSGSNLKGLGGGAPVVPLTSSQVEET